jgi:hypothetical protein
MTQDSLMVGFCEYEYDDGYNKTWISWLPEQLLASQKL